MGAGAVAGAIYKSTGKWWHQLRRRFGTSLIMTAGVRPAMVGAGLGIAFAASWSFFKTIV